MMEEKTPKILLITRNLPPLIGGMERLLLETAKGLSEYAELTVIGPKGCSKFLPNNTRTLETPAGLAGFLAASLWNAKVLCSDEWFDLVIGGSGVTAPCLAVLKRLYRLKTIIFLHGLDLVAPHFVYQCFFVPTVRKADLLIANSRNTALLAMRKGVTPEQLTVINPGCHPPDDSAYQRVNVFRKKHDIPCGPVMLFVGRMTRRKGLSQFIQQCLPEIMHNVPNGQLLVVGDQPDNALNREGEKQDVLKTVAQLPAEMQKRIHFVGSINDDDLNTSYALADVHIFPIKEVSGDIEGFGMVVIEAASYGTPTVAFDVGGVADAVKISAGVLISAEDYTAMAAAIVRRLTEREQNQPRPPRLEALYWSNFNQRVAAICRQNIGHPPL